MKHKVFSTIILTLIISFFYTSFMLGFNNNTGYINATGTVFKRFDDGKLTSDDKLLVVGQSNGDIGLIVQYNLDGTLDTNFGVNGFLTTNIVVRFSSVAIDSQDRIVAVGLVGAGTPDGVVARFNPDGSLDTEFNDTGWRNTEADFDSFSLNCVIVDDQDRIIVVGETDGTDRNSIIARFTAAGDLDTDFAGGDGFINTENGGTDSFLFNAVAFDDQQRIVAVGKTDANTGLIIRYTANGVLDTVFDDTPTVFSFEDCVFDKDQKLIVTGVVANNTSIISRYNTDGTLDDSFNAPNGYINTQGQTGTSTFYKCLVTNNDKIVVVGLTNTGNGIIAQYNPDGTINTSFNGVGYFTTQGIVPATFYGAIINNANRVYAFGETQNNAFVMSLLANGTLNIETIWNIFNYQAYWQQEGKSIALLG